MKSVLVWNMKGGVGKTTLATHLAWHYAEGGKRVLLMDGDSQMNATVTLSKGDASQIEQTFRLFAPDPLDLSDFEGCEPGSIDVLAGSREVVELGELYGRTRAGESLKKNLALLNDYYDVLIIDAAPGITAFSMVVLLMVDYLLVPIELSVHGMDSAKQITNVFTTVSKYRATIGAPNLKFLGLVPIKVDLRARLQADALEHLQEKWGGMLLPTMLKSRTAFAESAMGNPVWAIKGAKPAVKEMRALMELVEAGMNHE